MTKPVKPSHVIPKKLKVAIIVAHPDDETLWAGGTILSNPNWQCFIACLCRVSDTERAMNFFNALKIYKSEGMMADLDDSPEQNALNITEVENAILSILPKKKFDLIISHDPGGEYTRHIRHEEVSEAVINLWYTGKISSAQLWTFAYTDSNKQHYPAAIETASIYNTLTKQIWLRKHKLLTDTYGFEKKSWEAKTTPLVESFWRFTNADVAVKWLSDKRKLE